MTTSPILKACKLKALTSKLTYFITFTCRISLACHAIAQVKIFLIVLVTTFFQDYVFQIVNQFSVLNQKMLRTKFYFVFITLALYIDFEVFLALFGDLAKFVQS